MEAADQLFSLSLIFALSVDEAQARDYLFDSKRFRADFFAWMDTTKPDYPEIVAKANAILEEAKKAEVRVAEEPGSLPQKKT